MDHEGARAEQCGYFSELNISTSIHHQESVSGQLMNFIRREFDCADN